MIKKTVIKTTENSTITYAAKHMEIKNGVVSIWYRIENKEYRDYLPLDKVILITEEWDALDIPGLQ